MSDGSNESWASCGGCGCLIWVVALIVLVAAVLAPLLDGQLSSDAKAFLLSDLLNWGRSIVSNLFLLCASGMGFVAVVFVVYLMSEAIKAVGGR